MLKTWKKAISLVLVFALSMMVCVPAFAEEVRNNKQKYIDLSQNSAFYDPEFKANVIPFVIRNGVPTLLTKQRLNSILANDGASTLDKAIVDKSTENDEVTLDRAYYEYYTFSPSDIYDTIGSRKKVSADLAAPKGGGSVSRNISFTISQSFSTGVSTNSQKSAIQASCGFTWVKSASESKTYTLNLEAGQVGYLAFKPYYTAVKGTLSKYSNWDGFISSSTATGYSVKTTDTGEPDGLYYFVEY